MAHGEGLNAVERERVIPAAGQWNTPDRIGKLTAGREAQARDKAEDEVAQLIAGHHAFIGDHCIDLCHETITKERDGRKVAEAKG